MTERTMIAAVWLFILIWLCVGSGIIVVGSVAVIGWLIALGVDALVAVAMWVTGA
jgi:hypothetical protein